MSGSRSSGSHGGSDNDGDKNENHDDTSLASSYLHQHQRRQEQVIGAPTGKKSSNSAATFASTSNKSAKARSSKVRKLTPYLFDLLDADQSGCLSRDEVLSGVALMITDQRVNVTSQYLQLIGSIMTRSDVDNSGALDRKEFGYFLFHLAKSLNMSLDHLTESLMESNHCLDETTDTAAADRGSVWANASSNASFKIVKDEGDDMWEHEIPTLFAKYDESGDGVISRHELSVAMRKVVSEAEYDHDPSKSLSYVEVMGLFDQNDANSDGDLQLSEFSTFVSSFSLACGIPLKDAVLFLMKEADSAHDMDLALEGWKMMPYLFSVFDTDNNGTINRRELVENMGVLVKEIGLNMTLTEVWSIFGEVDDDDSHDLDRHEFGFFLSEFAKRGNVTVEEVTFYLSKLHKKGRSSEMLNKSLRGWDDMEQLFKRWDLDGDGYIDRRELGIGMSFFRHKCALSSIEYLKIMEEVDENKDGVLDRREMSAFLSRFALRAGIELDELTGHLMDCSPSEQSQRGGRISMSMVWGWAKAQLAEEAFETVNQVEASNSGRRMQPRRSSCY